MVWVDEGGGVIVGGWGGRERGEGICVIVDGSVRERQMKWAGVMRPCVGSKTRKAIYHGLRDHAAVACGCDSSWGTRAIKAWEAAPPGRIGGGELPLEATRAWSTVDGFAWPGHTHTRTTIPPCSLLGRSVCGMCAVSTSPRGSGLGFLGRASNRNNLTFGPSPRAPSRP